MAYLDLLNGGYTGHLGNLHGARRDGAYYARGHNRRPARPKPVQAAAWQACSCLRRLACRLAAHHAALLDLPGRSTTPAGAVMRWARAMIADQTFSPARWTAVVPPGDRVRLGAIAWQPETQTIRVDLAVSPDTARPMRSAIIAWAMDDYGYCGPVAQTPPDELQLLISPPQTYYGAIWICSMLISSYGRRTLRTDGDCRLIDMPPGPIADQAAEKLYTKGDNH